MGDDFDFFVLPFIIGLTLISKKIKVNKYLLILFILIPYFLSVSGATYYVNRAIDPSMPAVNDMRWLSTEKDPLYKTYWIYDTEVYSSSWFSLFKTKEDVYVDENYRQTIILGARIRTGAIIQDDYIPYFRDIESFANFSTEDFEVVNGYIYLRHINIVEKEYVTTDKARLADFSQQYVFLWQDPKTEKVYSNGGSEIYWRRSH